MLTPFQIRVKNALKGNPFFGRISDESIRMIRRRSVRRNERIFAKGEPADTVYGIVSGQVDLFSRGTDGRRISFGVLGRSEMFGDCGILAETSRPTNAIALRHCELAALMRADLERLMDRDATFRDGLLLASAEMTRRLDERLDRENFVSIEARVEKTLFDIARRLGEQPDPDASKIRIRS